jgi:GGDEF domain-containing protein
VWHYIYKFAQRNSRLVREIFLHQKLLAAHEELLASEEEFRQQMDELLQKEESVRRLAYHDSLTGLPNRSMLMEYLDKE